MTFAPLAKAVGASVAVHGVELPAHDPSRPAERPRPLRDVAAQLVEEIRQLDGDVVLYGHCLGGALAVETALQLEEAGIRVLGVVAGGTFPAARLPGRLARLVDRVLPTDRWLSDRAYHELLRSLGGFTDVVDPADRAFLVRALRHDAREAEGYYTERYDDADAATERRRLQAPMLCVVGGRDRATELYEERFAEWEDFSDDVDLAVIPSAGHYFLKHQADELAAILGEQVRRWRRGERPRARSAVAGASEASTTTFLWVALTQLLSMIGTGLTTFALGVWVLQQTGSVSRFAMISVLAVLPAILLSPVAGAVADRYDRRRVMVAADVVAGVATATLVGLVATDRLELWFVYVFAGVGLGRQRVPATRLPRRDHPTGAQALPRAGQRPGDARHLGRRPRRRAGRWRPGRALRAEHRHRHRRGDLRPGLRRAAARPLPGAAVDQARGDVPGRGRRWVALHRPPPALVVMVVFFVVFNFLFSVPLVLATPLVLAGNSPQTLGAVLAAGGIGALLGSLLMAVWGGTRRRAIGMVGGTITLGVSVVLLGRHRRAGGAGDRHGRDLRLAAGAQRPLAGPHPDQGRTRAPRTGARRQPDDGHVHHAVGVPGRRAALRLGGNSDRR